MTGFVKEILNLRRNFPEKQLMRRSSTIRQSLVIICTKDQVIISPNTLPDPPNSLPEPWCVCACDVKNG